MSASKLESVATRAWGTKFGVGVSGHTTYNGQVISHWVRYPWRFDSLESIVLSEIEEAER